MAQLNFDATHVPPQETVEALPAGWYNVVVDQSDLKSTAAPGGVYLEVRYNVIDGQYIGRKIFDRFNLQNSNVQASEIGQRQLSALCHAIGLLQVGDSSMLHGRPLKVKLKVRPATAQYEASNDVTGRKNINEQVDMAAAAPASAPAAPWAGAPVAQAPVAPVAQAPVAPVAPVAQAPVQAPPPAWNGQAAPAQAPAWSAPAAAQPWAGGAPAAAQPWAGGAPAAQAPAPVAAPVAPPATYAPPQPPAQAPAPVGAGAPPPWQTQPAA